MESARASTRTCGYFSPSNLSGSADPRHRTPTLERPTELGAGAIKAEANPCSAAARMKATSLGDEKTRLLERVGSASHDA